MQSGVGEIEYSNVGYFDRQTEGEDPSEDANEWLSVDIGEILEEEAATEQQKQQVLSLPICEKTSVDDCSLHPFIYDACPSSHVIASPASPKATSVEKEAPTFSALTLAEREDDDLKISFMNFKAGSIALFVPVDASKKEWMAFHSNRPNRFLAQQSLDVFLSRRGRNNDKTRILARIVYIEQHVAGCTNTCNNNTNNKTNTDKSVNSMNAASGRACGGVAASTTGVGAGESGGGVSGVSGGVSGSGGTDGVTGCVGDAGTTKSGAGSMVVRYETHRNPHNLKPGTVYYECFAEPITIPAAKGVASSK